MDFNTMLPSRVVVTGAQSGIGRAVSEAVLSSGASCWGSTITPQFRSGGVSPHDPWISLMTSKGAVVSLTRQLAAELGPAGIRVNAVAPGVIHTPMTTLVENPHATAELESRLPLQRLGRPEEVTSVCLSLASEAASYVTGAVFPVDGGYLVC